MTDYIATNLQHLNGNILCCIDCETTGLEVGKHEIIEVCFLPLDADLQVRKDIPPFDIQIKPENMEDIDFEAFKVTKIDLMQLCRNGMDKWAAVDLFERWCTEKLRLPHNKRISPLAHNWVFDSPFIRTWLGNKTYEYFIDGRYRDLMTSVLYENDCADRLNERVPFPKCNLAYVASQLKIPHDRAHNALADCIVTAQCYRELVLQRLPVGAQHI